MSDKFGLEVCEALGLNKNQVSSIKIDIQAGRPTIVEVGIHVHDGTSISDIVKRYTLAGMEQH